MSQQSLHLDRLATDLLEPVSLEIKPGEIACLSGPSGSGKSRLLRAIADLDPHEGRVRLGNYIQAELPAHQWRRMVMLVPAESAWWFDTVGEHIHTPQSATLQELGLEPEVTEWPVDRLSSGEKQRLALVRAVSCEPAALLLDEPTANLDPDTTRLVEHWLTGYIRQRQIPALWVAHDGEQIERVGNQHLRIADGRLEER